MRTKLFLLTSLLAIGLFGCDAEEKVIEAKDFAFDGTCVNCHAGLSAGHVHTNFKLRCVDCHGGNDQVETPEDVLENTSIAAGDGGFRDPLLLAQAHVLPDKNIARFFYANGVDDDGDGNCFGDPTQICEEDNDCAGNTGPCRLVDEPPGFDVFPNPTQLLDAGETFEPGLHGEGPGEFMDAELNRDLNFTRFTNPGDLRVASIGCGAGSRAAFDGEAGGACHQQTIDIVRRSIMVGQSAVTNGAYYGNESWRADFFNKRDNLVDGDEDEAADPRFGAMSYSLDYSDKEGVDNCIRPPRNPNDPRDQPFFDKDCLQDRAAEEDAAVAAGAQGNIGVGDEQPSAFEIAQGVVTPVEGLEAGFSLQQFGAGDTRFDWGGKPIKGDAHAELEPLANGFLPGFEPGNPLAADGIPDPVDNILRTFRAYYPLNYPASTNNFNFTFGTSILPEIARFRTGTPYGRGHASGCAACHTPYNYEGNRQPTKERLEDPQDTNGNGKLDDDELFVNIVDPTTKHREFDPAKDIGEVNGVDRLIGRPVRSDEVRDSGGVAQGAVDLDGDNTPDGEQQRTYSSKHETTAKIDTDTCGLCHGFVTRINYAYQGMAEEEQRDALARRAPIEFETPNGTKVEILDSWIREDRDVDNDGNLDAIGEIIIPEGVEIVNLARERDAKLAEEGFIAGFGGCVPAVFSEDCNNNGELDTNLVLEKKDADGNVLATTTINEDLDGNGKLGLIDRLPREKAIDGRQVRYVYGGRNGSTRQMDIHFQVGMHCIDCHFLQDVHGDGNVYSTNWDAIEIECEDCHGASKRTNFLTSGPNGGNDMRKALNEDLLPFFEERNGKVIQRSRVTTGLEWEVPQLPDVDAANPYAKEAHLPNHVAEPGAGSTFEGEQGSSELQAATVECAACHNGWITNCMGCHVEINVGDKQRDKVNPDGSIEKSAGENEIWVSNTHNPGHINFQLLGLLRAPFVLNTGGRSEQGRLGTVRSSMEVMAGASDDQGNTIRENLTFTTFQTIDANSGRMNVATSGVAMNQTMAHTVRPKEARGCEMCHSLVNDDGEVLNEHIMSQSMGLGSGSLTFTGDWLIATGQNGSELKDYKKERELGNNLNGNASTRFPGLIVSEDDPEASDVDLNNGQQGNDVLLIRNFNLTPAQIGGTQPPTLSDLMVTATTNGGGGRVVISDISGRGHPQAGAISPLLREDIDLAEPALALAHIASDVSDPFIYVANDSAGITVINITNIVNNNIQTRQSTVALNGNRSATEVALAGDLLYVGTADGFIQVFDINDDPEDPDFIGEVEIEGAGRINDIAINGFILVAGTQNGLAVLALDDPENPGPPAGAPGIPFIDLPTNGVAFHEGRVFAATGVDGIHEVDVRTPAEPEDLGSVTPGVNDLVDVIVSIMPGQKWLFGIRAGNGDIEGFKLDTRFPRQERCYPDPREQGCLLELEIYDPTRSGRDPSFDPVAGVFDNPNVDPSAKERITLESATIINGRRLARPVYWEQIGTLTGRRYRDSFMPGAGVLSLSVMQEMRNILVCEIPGGVSTNPSGLDELGYFVDGECLTFTEFASSQGAAARRKSVKPSCQKSTLGKHMKQLMCEPRTSSKAVGETAQLQKSVKRGGPYSVKKIPMRKTPKGTRTPVSLPPRTAAIIGMK